MKVKNENGKEVLTYRTEQRGIKEAFYFYADFV